MMHARNCEVGHFLLVMLNVFARINSKFSCVIASYFVWLKLGRDTIVNRSAKHI
jgi:hypothetical protein